MLTLLKRELKSLFCAPLSLSVITVLNMIPTVAFIVFMKISQTQSAYAGFENMISLMAIVFAVAIPAVSVISFVRDKKSGVDEFIYSMPVARDSFLLSKIFSQIIFFALPTVIIAVFPPIFANFGEVNFAHCYTALILLEAFEIFVITLSLMIASKAGKAISSIVITYSVLVLSFVLGVLSPLVRFLPFGTKFDSAVSGILTELSIFKKVDTVGYELFDWTALAFFAVGAIIFTVTALKNRKRPLATVLVSILLVACIGVVPLLLPYSVRQIDINKNKLYTPSVSTEEYLSSVNEDITVYLIDPYTNEQELYNAIVRTVEMGKNIKLEIVNSAEDKAFLEKYGLENEAQESLSYAMIVQGEERWSFINGQDYFSYYNSNMGYLSASELQYRYTYCATIVNRYYSYYDKLSAEMQQAVTKCVAILESLDRETLVCLQFENAFVQSVAYVTADMIPTVYFLSGHGEEGTLANPYDFKENGRLPENADVAVINSPSEDYSESEIKTLIDYVDNGGKLFILTDVDNYSMPNIMSLLSNYGLTVDSNVISVDEKSVIPVSVNKEHEAFSAMSASEVTVKDVSKIAAAENSKYTYSPMLSYKHTVGEGDNAVTTEYPVAISVREGGEKKITLFTGAVTFNSSDNGISAEELERVSPCVTNVMTWMFDSFESGISPMPPKLYQKSIYIADDGHISKIAVALFAVALAITLSLSAYIVSRRLRSKRALEKDEYSE